MMDIGYLLRLELETINKLLLEYFLSLLRMFVVLHGLGVSIFSLTFLYSTKVLQI